MLFGQIHCPTSLEQERMVLCYQNCSSDREKIVKFEAEGREFAKFLRSLEQFIQTVKGQNNFGNRMLF